MYSQIALRTVVYFALLLIALSLLYIFLSFNYAKYDKTATVTYFAETPPGDRKRI